MGGGGKGGNAKNPPRKRISSERFKGVITEWKQTWGWVKAAKTIRHAKIGDGRIYVHKDDVGFDVTGLPKNVAVEFCVYEDSRGLGAQEVRRAAPQRNSSAKADENNPLPAGWEKHWSAEHEEFYYWNKETKETTWTEPGKSADDEVLPPGWSKEWDAESEEFYYWHKASRTAHWELPDTAEDDDAADKQDTAEEEVAKKAKEAPVLGQLRTEGIVTSWQGIWGLISPLKELSEDLKPLLDRNQGKVSVNWRDVQGGVKLKVGMHVNFMLGVDHTGLVATGVRLHQDGDDDEEEEEEQRPAKKTKRSKPQPQPSHGLAELTTGEGDEELGGALLPGWTQHWSEDHKCYYYWHAATKQPSWERPAVPDDGDDDDDPPTNGDKKLWEGEDSEEGAGHLATPFTPLVSRPGRIITPATPVKMEINSTPAAAPSKRSMSRPPGDFEGQNIRPSQRLLQNANNGAGQTIPAWKKARAS